MIINCHLAYISPTHRSNPNYPLFVCGTFQFLTSHSSEIDQYHSCATCYLKIECFVEWFFHKGWWWEALQGNVIITILWRIKGILFNGNCESFLVQMFGVALSNKCWLHLFKLFVLVTSLWMSAIRVVSLSLNYMCIALYHKKIA